MGMVKGSRTPSRPSIQLICFLFISHQSNQQIPRYSYLKIWPLKDPGQGHGWDQRSRSHSWPGVQLMHFLFVSWQSDQPFLKIWPIVFDLENTSSMFKKNSAKKKFPTEFPHLALARGPRSPALEERTWETTGATEECSGSPHTECSMCIDSF